MSEKQQQVIDRGLEAKKFIEAPVYQKVLNSLIDECVAAWATSKIEEKEKRDMFWHRYQSAIAMHSTLQSWITAGEQEQKNLEEINTSKDNQEIH
tara:strand:- start:536 stop:820 length:285 start_codon:yes stop_codon:yes gene_type:complete